MSGAENGEMAILGMEVIVHASGDCGVKEEGEEEDDDGVTKKNGGKGR